MSDYWTTTIEEGLEDAGLSATKAQIDTLAGWAESAHEHYGQAHGHDVMFSDSGPSKHDLQVKIRNLEAELDQMKSIIKTHEESVKRRRNADYVWVENGHVYYE